MERSRLTGIGEREAPSYLAVVDTVLVGGTYGSILAFYNGARGDIYGDLILGQNGSGNIFLTQGLGFSGTTNLSVSDALFGACLIGREFMGEVIINTGSSLNCRNVELGLAGTGGPRHNHAGWRLLERFGDRACRPGHERQRLDRMGNNATVVAGVGMHIAPNGLVSGSGQIILGSMGLLNEGVLGLGITVIPALATEPQPLVVAQDSLATMVITGTLTISPTGRLEIPLTGTSAGQYGSLAVTGSAALDGVLALNFSQGFAPKQGDTFTFLSATDSVSGMFDSVEISGLKPGFEYELTIVDGQVTSKP